MCDNLTKKGEEETDQVGLEQVLAEVNLEVSKPTEGE